MFDLTRWRNVRLTRSRIIPAVIGVTLGVVILAPVALSFGSLVLWAETSLGLTGAWPYIVPISLDAAALLSMALVFHAVTHAESATFPRLLVWGFAIGSAIANYRHGATVSPDAAIYFPAMPIAAALLLEVTLRRVRRTILADLGVTEKPLARFRAIRWVRFPRETFAAWSSAVEHGLSSPNDALAVATAVEPLDPAALDMARERRALDALPSDAARVRHALAVSGETDPQIITAWLHAHGREVKASTVRSAVIRAVAPARTPARPVPALSHPVAPARTSANGRPVRAETSR